MNVIKKLLIENSENIDNVTEIINAIKLQASNFEGLNVDVKGADLEFFWSQEWRDNHNVTMLENNQDEIIASALDHLKIYNPELF
jgi:hypothetical protein